MPQIIPMNNWALIERDADTEEKDGSIIIPETVAARKKCKMGTVVSVGSGMKNSINGTRDPINIKPGDRILYERVADFDFLKYGDNYTLINAFEDIEAVITESAERNFI